MKLLLTNGYPFPFPEGGVPDDFEGGNVPYDCRDYSLQLDEVVHFEWLHTITVEFANAQACETARNLTGWFYWGLPEYLTLEARASTEDGYEHPAIVAKDTAYCGFTLLA